MNDDYLEHYGIKGMHWGVRRFQNADGSLTAAGKKRYGSEDSSDSERKSRTKKIVAGVLMAATVAGAAYVYSQHPDAVKNLIKGSKGKTLSSVSDAAAVGKNYINNIGEGLKRTARNKLTKAGMKTRSAISTSISEFKEGIGEGVRNAPRKVGRGLGEGAAIIGATAAINAALGEKRVQDAIKSYNAYNKKNKIGQVTSADDFIRGYYDRKNKDDDED